MKITTVAVQKGGVGKTMMAYNIAAALAEKEKVLAIDVDPQCNLSNNFGLDVSQRDVYSSRDIFEENTFMSPEDMVVEQPIPVLPNLDVIPSNIFMFETDISIIGKTDRERILKYYIEDNISFFKKYDHIIIDTNPSMSILNQNALLAADSIILVSEADDNSRVGVELFMYLWGKIRKALRKEDNVKALILNKADVRTTLTNDIIEYWQNHEDLSDILVSQTVRAKVAFSRAAANRIPVTLYKGDGGKEAAEEIYNVVAELKAKGVF